MAESVIAWVDGALAIVDQRALPHHRSVLRIENVDQLVEAITTMAIRGAPALGLAGAFGVALAASCFGDDLVRVRSEAARIAAARPTAVNLSWGVQRALSQLSGGFPAVLHTACQLMDEGIRINRAAATHAADLVQRLCPQRPLRILTHCNTGPLAAAGFGTALGALDVLHSRGAIDQVLVGETRPLLQGARLTTYELGAAGIPHRLTIDSAAAWAMANGLVDCVVVGADRVTADGSVANKVGTYSLAIAAQHHRLPFIVVAPESTRDLASATGSDIVVEERPGSEITQVGDVVLAPAGTATFNPAFDVTPPQLITAVVTENGEVAESNALVARQIAALARDLHGRGWMPGTSGNISVRTGATSLITASGLSKGGLTDRDTVSVQVADSRPESEAARPSAEVAIHTAIYRATQAGAVVHVHSPHATAVSVSAGTSIRFSGYELIKGLEAQANIEIPVFANDPDVAQIGLAVEEFLTGHPDAPPVLIIAGHGVTGWGVGLEQARDRVECLEALCELATLTGKRER
ncbi:S-methyl-5-thioribose-1-phosphate isomerase [Mycolicibacter minnesotensis]